MAPPSLPHCCPHAPVAASLSATDLVAPNHTHLPSHRSVGQGSGPGLTGLKSRCWRGWFLLEAPGKSPCPGFAGFPRLPALCGSRPLPLLRPSVHARVFRGPRRAQVSAFEIRCGLAGCRPHLKVPNHLGRVPLARGCGLRPLSPRVGWKTFTLGSFCR